MERRCRNSLSTTLPKRSAEADKLVTEVMASRGYPMGDFEQRAADISVNYPGSSKIIDLPGASQCGAIKGKPVQKTYAKPWFTTGRCLTSCSITQNRKDRSSP